MENPNVDLAPAEALLPTSPPSPIPLEEIDGELFFNDEIQDDLETATIDFALFNYQNSSTPIQLDGVSSDGERMSVEDSISEDDSTDFDCSDSEDDSDGVMDDRATFFLNVGGQEWEVVFSDEE